MLRSLRRFLFLGPLVVLAASCSEAVQSPLETSDDPLPPILASSECAPADPPEVLLFRIRLMQDEVDGHEASGVLNKGQARALSNHLTNAARQLERGQNCAVQDQLAAFREQLEDFIDDSAVSDRDAFELRLQSRLATTSEQTPPPGEEEQYAPGVTGETRSLTVDGSEIVYEVIDGLAIFTGDVILGYADELEERAAGGASAAGGGPEAVGPCVQDGLICGTWSDGVIGFDFFIDWGDFTENQRMIDLILQAIRHWEDETGLRFERRGEGERIIFRDGAGCSSWVGRQVLAIFDPQYVFLSNEMCDDWGVIAHEIGHAVGFFHEQSRNDRSDYVAVHFDAIQDDAEANFFQYVVLGEDLGRYDFGSIMHYACRLFRAEDATRDPIEPLVEGVTCADIGQRRRLSESNILGAYWLYRPVYSIGGAVDGETRDRFELFTDFTTEPVDDAYIVWTVNRSRVSTGPTFSTLEQGLAPGEYVIGADIVIDGVTVEIEFISITIDNDPPVVDLGPDLTIDLNRTVRVSADVTDTDDGSCPATACTYTWDPEPVSTSGGVADYLFESVPAGGTATIRLTVADGSGLTGEDEMVVTVVDSPPVPVIHSPGSGPTFSSGATVPFEGSATDANDGPGPGPGIVSCGSLDWTSSDPTDVVTETTGCEGTVLFGDAGTRTLTLEATDLTGNTATTSITLHVDGCDDGGCAPDISFVFETEPDLDGSQYDPPFTEPGYLLDTSIQMKALVSDVDGPPTAIALEWRVQPPCLFAGCDDFVIGSTNVFAPNTSFQTWRPSDNVVAWGNCVSIPLPHMVSLHATDGSGNTRVYSRTIYLGCDLR